MTTKAPFVAESDMLTSYSDPNNAVCELNQLHAQIINAVYYPGVLNKWDVESLPGADHVTIAVSGSRCASCVISILRAISVSVASLEWGRVDGGHGGAPACPR